jgi:hypothetical protein
MKLTETSLQFSLLEIYVNHDFLVRDLRCFLRLQENSLSFEEVGRAVLHIPAFSPCNEQLLLWFELQHVESYDINIKQHENYPLIKHGM